MSRAIVVAFPLIILAAPGVLDAEPRRSDQDLSAALGQVRGSAVRAHVEFLADDHLEGRKSGTRGYEVAARYVAAQLKAMGLAPAGDEGTYFQQVPLQESVLERGEVSLTPTKGSSPIALVAGEDYLMSGDPATTEAAVEAPVVFAGFGITAPELDHDDYEGSDVRGKIVAVLSNAPARFPSEQRAHFASGRQKAENAARRGAVGVLLLRTPEEEAKLPWSRVVKNADSASVRWLRPDGRPESTTPQLRGSAALSLVATRKLFASSAVALEDAVASAAKSRTRAFPLGSARLESRSKHRRFTSPNVVGRLEGSDPSLKDTSVVLSAHLDHIGTGTAENGDAIYNGAYDNATGTGVVLEAARALVALRERPRRSILFLFVTSEENGLLGSDYFANRPTARAGKVVANVNIDMPLLLYPLADVVAFGAENSSLDGVVSKAAARAGLSLSPDFIPEENVFTRSDQYSFVRRGIPAVFLVPGLKSKDPSADGAKAFGEFFARHYHRPSDDLSLPIDLGSVERFVRANVLVTHAIASDPRAPQWKPGNFFGKTFGPGQPRD
ncbi:MAG TPA: M28 family metallopeptidase [Vicinamibacteria bacterium]